MSRGRDRSSLRRGGAAADRNRVLVQVERIDVAAGRLVLGPKAERRFGRRNFMGLFAVFSSPLSFTVQIAAGQALGTLNQSFVDRLVDGVNSFRLVGCAWAVVEV